MAFNQFFLRPSCIVKEDIMRPMEEVHTRRAKLNCLNYAKKVLVQKKHLKQ